MRFNDNQQPSLPTGVSRLTFRRLRRPTPVPPMPRKGWSNYLARLSWLFG